MSATGSQPSTPENTNIFSKWSRKFSAVTGIGITEGERLQELEAHQYNVCNRWKKELMNYSGFACLPPPSFVQHSLNTHYSRSGRGFHVETTRTVRLPRLPEAFELSTVQLRSLWWVRARRGYHDTLPG